MDSWHRLLMLAYKWATLPVVLLAFFGGQGWDALRVAQGYAETTGIITQYRCAKVVTIQFTYTVGDVARQGSSSGGLSGFECPPYSVGQTVKVYYSTQHPELALMNATPQQALRHQVLVILAILLAFPFVTFLIAYKEWSREH